MNDEHLENHRREIDQLSNHCRALEVDNKELTKHMKVLIETM